MRLPGVTRGAIEGAGAGRDGPLESPPGALGALGAAESAGVIVGGGSGGIGGGPGVPPPLRPCRSSRMVGRRLACRDAPRLASTSLNPRDRHLTREIVT